MYFSDTGILQQLAQISCGQVFENKIALQLLKKGNLTYYQKKSGQEIDFILDEKIAIEIKETPDSRDLKTLRRRANDIQLHETMLIGRNSPSNDFDEWYWGGNVG